MSVSINQSAITQPLRQTLTYSELAAENNLRYFQISQLFVNIKINIIYVVLPVKII